MTSREALIDEVQTLRARAEAAEKELSDRRRVDYKLLEDAEQRLAEAEKERDDQRERGDNFRAERNELREVCKEYRQRLARVREWAKAKCNTLDNQCEDDLGTELLSILDSEDGLSGADAEKAHGSRVGEATESSGYLGGGPAESDTLDGLPCPVHADGQIAAICTCRAESVEGEARGKTVWMHNRSEPLPPCELCGQDIEVGSEYVAKTDEQPLAHLRCFFERTQSSLNTALVQAEEAALLDPDEK